MDSDSRSFTSEIEELNALVNELDDSISLPERKSFLSEVQRIKATIRLLSSRCLLYKSIIHAWERKEAQHDVLTVEDNAAELDERKAKTKLVELAWRLALEGSVLFTILLGDASDVDMELEVFRMKQKRFLELLTEKDMGTASYSQLVNECNEKLTVVLKKKKELNQKLIDFKELLKVQEVELNSRSEGQQIQAMLNKKLEKVNVMRMITQSLIGASQVNLFEKHHLASIVEEMRYPLTFKDLS